MEKVFSDLNRIAILKGGENQIHILTLGSGAVRDFTVKGWTGFNSLDWSPDGKGFFRSEPHRYPQGRRKSDTYPDPRQRSGARFHCKRLDRFQLAGLVAGWKRFFHRQSLGRERDS